MTASILFLVLFLVGFIFPSNIFAIYDPLSVPNNKIGVHILHSDELESAAKLVNNQEVGEWGYVTIPIQASDRNRDKWQKFFDLCLEKKVIPVIRIATVAEGSNWAEPNGFDPLDFANFLNELHWPVKNRYVIIFNEVNRADEYGGYVSPEKYADILSNASDIFKSRSGDFFILPAGLDNAASNGKSSLHWRVYLERMYLHRPEIFDKIDGWTSHAYPNPDFSANPIHSGSNKTDSFQYDLRFINLFTNKKLPVFITETGWSNKLLSDTKITEYYEMALNGSWQNSQIVAITPFILNAQDGNFQQFSFTEKDGKPKEYASLFASYATKGEPILSSSKTPETDSSTTTTNQLIPSTVEYQDKLQAMMKKLYNNLIQLIKTLGQ